MDDEWTGEKRKQEETDLEQKYWGIEDMHGHRYYAQLSDGKDRWMLPLPRKAFEELFAAVCEENPWVGDTFRTPSNFLRQYVGNMMQWMVENGTDEPPPEVERVLLKRQVAEFDEQREDLRQMSVTLGNSGLPKAIRLQAGRLLLAVEEDVLEAAIGETHSRVRDAMVHVEHDV